MRIRNAAEIANTEDMDHYATDSTCPLLLEAQKKLKMTHFYKQQMFDSRRDSNSYYKKICTLFNNPWSIVTGNNNLALKDGLPPI